MSFVTLRLTLAMFQNPGACVCVSQEVQHRKAAQKEADKLRAEVEGLKPQLTAASTKVAELQAANASLRVSVNDLKQRLLLAADEATSLHASSMHAGQQLQDSGSPDATGVQQQLAHSQAEAERLKQQLESMQRHMDAAASVASGPADPAAVQQLAALQHQAAALQQENQELRQELAAFDPAFFEELEDLKHSHHQLQQKAAAQAKLIRQLQGQLANSTVRQPSRAGSLVGPEGSSGSVGGRSSRLAP